MSKLKLDGISYLPSQYHFNTSNNQMVVREEMIVFQAVTSFRVLMRLCS